MAKESITLNWFLVQKLFTWIYSVSIITIGLTYILAQYFVNDVIKDAVFVGLLLGGSFILIFGSFWIYNFFKTEIEEFQQLIDDANDEKKTKFYTLLGHIFSFKKSNSWIFLWVGHKFYPRYLQSLVRGYSS